MLDDLADAHVLGQGAIDETLKGNIITVSECAAMTASLTILLSMLGLDLARLLAPAGFACAYAAKDLLHNFLAGEGHAKRGAYGAKGFPPESPMLRIPWEVGAGGLGCCLMCVCMRDDATAQQLQG